MQKILADDTFCVCIATAVDLSIQVQMNQWKIVWLPVWIKCDILSRVVLYFVRVGMHISFPFLFYCKTPVYMFVDKTIDFVFLVEYTQLFIGTSAYETINQLHFTNNLLQFRKMI